MIGDTVSNFRIIEKLGSGGMGVLYKAEDTKLRSTVALKFLPPELSRDEKAKTRFIREARALAALDHPNICTVHSINETPDGQLFICMAYYDGESLKERLGRERLTVRDAVIMAVRILEGLDRAHQAGIVHRDIKPANIMLTRDGTPKILDFGIAKVGDWTHITREGMTPGTLGYMSPEQMGSGDVDARSDIFSLGVVLYEMLTGKPPFHGDQDAAVQYKVVNLSPEPITAHRRGLPDGLSDVVDKALQKDVGKRYQTAADMKRDLVRILRGKLPHPHAWRYITGVAAAAAVALLVWWAVGRIGPSVATRNRVLVTPVTPMQSNEHTQLMAAGLNAVMSKRLQGLERFANDLWVTTVTGSRARVFGEIDDVDGVFGVNLILASAFEASEDGFRLTTTLQDAATQEELDRTVVTGKAADLIRTYSEPVRWMAERLDITLSDEVVGWIEEGAPVEAAAYEPYLAGWGVLDNHETGEEDAALAFFEQALGKDSTFAAAYVGLAEVARWKYSATGDTVWLGQAIRDDRRSLALDPESPWSHVALGQALNDAGRYEQALSSFRRAIDIHPGNFPAYRGMAEAYQGLNRPEDAERTYRSFIGYKPDFYGGYEYLGFYYYRQGRYGRAAEQYDHAVELAPRYYLCFNDAGAFNYLAGRLDRAQQLWEQSFAIRKSYQSCSNLGTLYYRQGRYADAARMYEWAVQFDHPAISYVTWGNLASAYFWAPGERGKARDVYERAIAMAEDERREAPTDAAVRSYLAGYYADVGDTLRSRQMIDEALELGADNAEVLFRVGHACEKLGERERALIWIGRAMERGYSVDEIDSDPELEALRTDGRYRLLAAAAEKK